MLQDGLISANHQNLWQHIKSLHAAQKLPHALLFEGAFGVGKSKFAYQVAKLILGINSTGADLYILKPENQVGNYTIDQIRFIQKLVECTPYESHYRVFILHQADRLGVQPSNAFLKLLEEPPQGNHFILLSSKQQQLLPTLKSRLQSFHFPSMATQELHEALKDKNLNLGHFLQLAEGSLGKAEKIGKYLPFLEGFFEILPLGFPGYYPQYRRLFESLDQDDTFDFRDFCPLFEDLLRDLGKACFLGPSASLLPWDQKGRLIPFYSMNLAHEFRKLEAAAVAHVKPSSAFERFFLSLQRL